MGLISKLCASGLSRVKFRVVDEATSPFSTVVDEATSPFDSVRVWDS